ncbi:MAG: type II CRISPR RNA-guided endonuclease Cas9 [Defluviitaleaceae bacterium]|nr:type II CRISPR RNA-guided endonuclease Cas9 [Defluviitaleaceae bacterium]
MRYNIGLDIGIASVGFAVTELGEDDLPFRLVRIGSRIFDIAENPKDGSSLAVTRREARGMRRRLRRKRHRKERIRNLIVANGILTQSQLDNLFTQSVSDIYELRRDALERAITQEELARIMLHLAQRRGFLSNRRTDNKDKEAGKMLNAIMENNASISEKKYRTVGEMLFYDERYKVRKRNKSDYLNVVTRSMILDEAAIIFSTQRDFGNRLCNKETEEKYIKILSSQRKFDEGPGKGYEKSPSHYAENLIEKMVGFCTFEKEQKRAAKATYSFEYFNLLQKINNMRIEERGYSHPLTDEQRLSIVAIAHKSPSLTYSKIRKEINLPDSFRFNIRYSEDFAADEAKTKFEYLTCYHEMRKALAGVSKDRINFIAVDERNSIGQIFSMYKDEEKIKSEFANAGIDPIDIESLLNSKMNFRKFGHLSVMALDNIIPYLEQGLTYDKACEEAGYNFKGRNGEKRELISLKHLQEELENTITSPVVRRSLSQCAKVINAIIREMGKSPVFINMELSREMAKNYKERQKDEKSMLLNFEKNEKIKTKLKEDFGITNPSPQDIVKMKLYETQGGVCPYSISSLDPTRLLEYGYAEIDHIVPYSISFNDTYANKVLARGNIQQRKGNRLPLDFLSGKERDNFIVWVERSNLRPDKKKRLLKEEITAEETTMWKDRALVDTQTISRFLYNYLTDFLLFDEFATGRKRHVTAINGQTTGTLRKRWGLVKIREDGDLHHAADAAVIACTTQKMINDISNHHKYRENRYANTKQDPRGDIAEKFPQPYPFFREELMARLVPTKEQLDIAMGQLNPMPYPDDELSALKPVFVSRMPSRKVSGAAHKETIKGITSEGEQVKKTPLTALKLDKHGEIPNYYKPESDKLLYSALKEHLHKHGGDAKNAFANDFYMPNRDEKNKRVVRRVKTVDNKSGIAVHGGIAENDEMVRVDVFHVADDGFYLVPIYVADTIDSRLPNKAIVANKKPWKEMRDEDFIFSLYPNDLIFIKGKGSMEFKTPKTRKKSSLDATKLYEDAFVYYKGADRSTGAISIINHDNSYENRVGVKTLLIFEKYQVDMLGNISKVTHETRQPFSR